MENRKLPEQKKRESRRERKERWEETLREGEIENKTRRKVFGLLTFSLFEGRSLGSERLPWNEEVVTR